MTHEEAAPLVWQVLIAAADQRQVLNYDLISEKLDRKLLARGMSTPLDLISRYCREKNYPALTTIAVNKSTGKPGPGYWGSTDVDKERERVYAMRWFAEDPPTRADFEAISKKPAP